MSLGFSIHKITSHHMESRVCLHSFQFDISSILRCLIPVTRTSRTVSSESDESRYACIIPDI